MKTKKRARSVPSLARHARVPCRAAELARLEPRVLLDGGPIANDDVATTSEDMAVDIDVLANDRPPGVRTWTRHVLDTTADAAHGLFVADIGKDGDMDVLSASYADDTITWFENDNAGNFAAKVVSTAADGAYSVFAADINEDGYLDVLSASQYDNEIAWYKYDSQSKSFGPQQIISTSGSGAYCVCAADLDGDEHVDVLSGWYDNDRISWSRNTDGAGTFGPLRTITTQANGVQCVVAVDLDGDDRVDVLSASQYDDKIAWYRNDGTGTFGPQQIISDDADGAFSVFAADVDNDEHIDVLSASAYDDKIAWYRNDGAGGFGPEQVVSTAADGAFSVFAADLDDDGDLDVLSASRTDDTIAWYENEDGAGSFGSQQIIYAAADYATMVSAADLDGDGDEDVISVSHDDDTVAWYENGWQATGTLEVAAVTQGEHGSVSINPDGTVHYCPDGDFNGQDSFTYYATDGQANSGEATVAITVTPVNDAPVALDDSYTTDEDQTLTVAAPGVLANDLDVEDDALTAELVSGVSHGTLMLNADGSFSYVPAADFNGQDGFSYKAYDGELYSEAGAVTITVNAVNDSPEITSLTVSPQVVQEDGTATLTGEFSDPDVGDVHTVTVAWGDGESETWTLGVGDRTFSMAHQYLDDDPSGTAADTYTITVTVSDAAAGDTANATVTVENVAPVIVAVSSSSPFCGGAVEGEEVTLSAAFTDVGTLDTHTAVVDWGDGGELEPLAVVEAGGSGTASGGHVYEYGGVYTVTVTVTDDDGGWAEATSTAVVTGVGLNDGVLQIVGTESNDRVTVNRFCHGRYKVHASFLPRRCGWRRWRAFDGDEVERIEIILCGGNDLAVLAGDIPVTAVIDGGAGNDLISGGRGANVLLGGDGRDVLLGGLGRDLLIGGGGGDLLVGGFGQDILVGGSTVYDSDPAEQRLADSAALLAILAEWNCDRPRATRVANIEDGSGSEDRLNDAFFLKLGETVLDDGERDLLIGCACWDWLLRS